MSRNRWDIVLDGNNYRLARGQANPYSREFVHSSVDEFELFNPFLRGTMQSRNDFRSFRQTDWSGGQTWFKPTLPNAGGDTYASASLFDAWTKPGNLVPLNQVTQASQAEGIQAGHLLVDESGDIFITSSTDSGASFWEIWKWDSSANDFAALDNGGGQVEGPATSRTFIHSMILTDRIDFGYVLGNGAVGSSSTGMISYFDPDGTPNEGNYISASGAILTYDFEVAPGSALMYWDGELCLYDGDFLLYFSDPSPVTTTITDDGLGRDILQFAGMWDTSPGGGMIVDPGSINLATATDRGIYYVKNVRMSSGQPQARIFRVEVTDSGTYLREPIGSLPEGIMALNIFWHLDSLLIIGTPDWGLLQSNNRAGKYPRTQLYHVTQGSVGAVGMFDGARSPSEAPLYFVKADGNIVWIGSDTRMWAYDTVRGGLHQAFTYPTAFTSGIISAAPQLNSGSEHINVMVGEDVFMTQKFQMYDDPKTGSWAAGSYTLESNYFDFGVPLESKTLRSVQVLFEKGSANETYYIDVEADDAGSWTNVASHTCDNGDAIIVTDLTGNSVTGNRFRYRIRLEVDSGTNMPEFRGIEFKAVTGEKVETWTLTLDGTEITNVQNVKQRPQDVYDNLVATAVKDGIVSFTDNYAKIEEDGTAIDVRIDQVQLVQPTEGESIIQVRLTKVDV